MSSKPIYSFPDFKEPEKSSSWPDEQRPGWKPVDHELEKAQRRTELIKERMSPPGALNLPPLLEAQRLKYGIPDGAFRSQALFDRIYVFPLDAVDGEEAAKTSGGLFKPAVTQLKDKQEGHRGVLLSAGLTAADRLSSHGIGIGHVVMTNKNVPFAHRCENLSDFAMYYLVMRDADLAGSETLMNQLRAGERRVVDIGGDHQFEHQIATVSEDGTLDYSKKQSVYISDTW